MNFKRFHESKNLWSEDYTGISTSITYTPLNVGSGEFTMSTTSPSVSAGAPLFLLSGNVSSGASTATNGVTNQTSRTVSSTDGYITVAYRNVNGSHPEDYNTMLNTGSEPLPYEPYSSEVWHDIPYYQHKTATDTLTLPATLYPNDTSITVGLKGNEEHTGTPSPQNPVMPQGTGERTGNYFNDFTVIGQVPSVTNGALVNYTNGATTDLFEIPEATMTLSIYDTMVVYIFLYDENKEYIGWVNVTTEGSCKTTTIAGYANAKYARIRTDNYSTYLNEKKIMLNSGLTALPYEPYGYKIPILLNSQTINKYLGSEQTTRKVKKLVLDGTENWILDTQDANRTVCHITLRGVSGNYGYCTHIYWKSQYQTTEYDRVVWNASAGGLLYISLSNGYLAGQTVADFKAYLAQQYANGTPVTIWYTLAEPETAVVNEPLMKIGTYADSLTTSIQCTAGENTLDVQTTVQPSEVTAGFSGWHPVQSVHERENGQWD